MQFNHAIMLSGFDLKEHFTTEYSRSSKGFPTLLMLFCIQQHLYRHFFVILGWNFSLGFNIVSILMGISLCQGSASVIQAGLKNIICYVGVSIVKGFVYNLSV